MEQQEDFSKYNGEGTTLRRAQLRMLDILIEIDRICRKHNIPYWLDYGTLLGAVRHQGFIPWDDDVDISMMEKDYNHFLQIVPEELSSQFIIQNHKNERYFPYPITRIVDLKSEATRDNYAFNHCEHKGLWVDIFPVIKGNIKLRQPIDFLYGRCYRRIHHLEPVNVNFILAYLLFPFAWIGKVFVKTLGKLNKKMVVYELGIPLDNNGTQFLYDDFIPTKDIIFENIILQAPNKTDKVLKLDYGDYMQIPAESQRIQHSIDVRFF